MKLILGLVLIALLSGCGLFKQKVVDREVLVTVPCKITPPSKPVMPLTDSGVTTDTIFIKVKKALAEIDLRKGYESELEAAIRTCQ